MSRETLADHGYSTVMKSSSGTVHEDKECRKLRFNSQTKAREVPADSVPTGFFDECMCLEQRDE